MTVLKSFKLLQANLCKRKEKALFLASNISVALSIYYSPTNMYLPILYILLVFIFINTYINFYKAYIIGAAVLITIVYKYTRLYTTIASAYIQEKKRRKVHNSLCALHVYCTRLQTHMQKNAALCTFDLGQVKIHRYIYWLLLHL